MASVGPTRAACWAGTVSGGRDGAAAKAGTGDHVRCARRGGRISARGLDQPAQVAAPNAASASARATRCCGTSAFGGRGGLRQATEIDAPHRQRALADVAELADIARPAVSAGRSKSPPKNEAGRAGDLGGEVCDQRIDVLGPIAAGDLDARDRERKYRSARNVPWLASARRSRWVAEMTDVDLMSSLPPRRRKERRSSTPSRAGCCQRQLTDLIQEDRAAARASNAPSWRRPRP